MKRILITLTLLLLTVLAAPSYCSQDASNLVLSATKKDNKVFISWHNFKPVALAETQKPKALFWELSNGKQTKNGALPLLPDGTIKATLAPDNYAFELRTCIVEIQLRPIVFVLGPVQAHLDFTVEAPDLLVITFNVTDDRKRFKQLEFSQPNT